MKQIRSVFVFALIFLTGAVARAQDPGAKLIGDVGTTGDGVCEIHMALMDRFLAELLNDPSAQGAIVIYQPGVDLAAVAIRERMVRSHLTRRRFDPMRITLMRGTPQSDAVTQYWVVPVGAEMPKIAAAGPNAPKIKPERVLQDHEATAAHDAKGPYVFIEYSDAGGASGCEEEGEGVYWEELLAKRLKENPGSRSNIVIKMPTRSDFRAKEQEIARRLVSYGITKARFRTFHTKTEFERMIELWVLPGRARAPKIEKRSALSDDAARSTALRDVERYTADINSHPDDPDAYMLRAKAFSVLDRTDEAIADLTRAIGLSTHPYYKAQAMTDRGKVYLKRKEYAKANADLSTVIALQGADAYKPGAYLNRARSEKERGALAAALKDAGEAIKLYSALKKTGAKKKQLGEAYALRASINCAIGDARAASADGAKAVALGMKSKGCATK